MSDYCDHHLQTCRIATAGTLTSFGDSFVLAAAARTLTPNGARSPARSSSCDARRGGRRGGEAADDLNTGTESSSLTCKEAQPGLRGPTRRSSSRPGQISDPAPRAPPRSARQGPLKGVQSARPFAKGPLARRAAASVAVSTPPSPGPKSGRDALVKAAESGERRGSGRQRGSHRPRSEQTASRRADRRGDASAADAAFARGGEAVTLAAADRGVGGQTCAAMARAACRLRDGDSGDPARAGLDYAL